MNELSFNKLNIWWEWGTSEKYHLKECQFIKVSELLIQQNMYINMYINICAFKWHTYKHWKFVFNQGVFIDFLYI